jgi:RNA polymerase sigma-70 factor (ECF subfamily)
MNASRRSIPSLRGLSSKCELYFAHLTSCPDELQVAVLPTKDHTEDESFASARRRLERAVSAHCPYLEVSERQDIVQAACLRLIKIREKGEGNREFNASYLWRVAYSALIDEIRRQRRRREEPLEQETLDAANHPAGNPERETASREVGSAIRSCLLGLVRNRRLAVTLYLQGYGVPEAARLLGWPRKKAENLVYRGLADMRQCLAGKGIEP